MMLYLFLKITRNEAGPYPLNLIDAFMDCSTYLAARPVETQDMPAVFGRRSAVPYPHCPMREPRT